jgi:hypothetical protein
MIFRKLTTMLMAGLLATTLGLGMTACEVEDEGEMPDVDVEGDAGNLPEYDIEQEEEGEMPDVDVDAEGGELPDVDTGDVDVEVDYDSPDEQEREERRNVGEDEEVLY